MVEIKETEAKVTSPKKVINVKNVNIVEGKLIDIETGLNNVLEQIEEEIPDGVECFNFKISFELPDEEDGE